jgi:hypothetical protein
LKNHWQYQTYQAADNIYYKNRDEKEIQKFHLSKIKRTNIRL